MDPDTESTDTVDADRAAGVLLGLACGDALGRPVEFETPATIRAKYGRVTEMLAEGTWNKPAGTITDDTDLALRLARSLTDCGGFDPADVARRYVEWYESDPFDVGGMTARSLSRIRDGSPWHEAGRAVWETSPEGSNAGNGSLMRTPPLAVAYADRPGRLVEVSRDESTITHADPRCTAGCAVANLVVAGLLRGVDDPLPWALAQVDDLPSALASVLDPVPVDDPEQLRSTGYVVDTLQTALHYGLGASSAEAALVDVVNRGGDADTVAAVTGAVVGARFGAAALPDHWLRAMDTTAELRRLALTLAER